MSRGCNPGGGHQCPVCDAPGPGDVDADGYMLGDNHEQIGYCNSCGEEATVGQECCEDGEVMPVSD